MHIQPYLFFDGQCEEALEFYSRALGARLNMKMRFSECPDLHPAGTIPPGAGNKIMHASLQIGDTDVMLSDGRCTGQPVFQGMGLTLNVAGIAEADRVFTALAEGGKVHMPLGQTFFSPRFGMVQDRFGVLWLILAAQPSAGQI